jgi:glycosyltransferase involved in cell wall biosynthesis
MHQRLQERQTSDVIARPATGVASISTVAVLLCTLNGARYLAEQLESIAAQDHPHWKVRVSDDGSTDDTIAILQAYQAKWGKDRISIHPGLAQGFVTNFLSQACSNDIDTDYYGFSDQDDIWASDKLSRAVAWLDGVPDAVPALYCARTKIVDDENNDLGCSPLFTKPPCFSNALVQSIAGGNTIVFNKAARRLVQQAGLVKVQSHDWWLYLVVTGCGGVVYYDPRPSLRYRQHGTNLVGTNTGWRARGKRVRQLASGHLRIFSEQHIRAFDRLRGSLTQNSTAMLEGFTAARKASIFGRAFGFAKVGIHRQTLLGNIGLIAAVIFNKI